MNLRPVRLCDYCFQESKGPVIVSYTSKCFDTARFCSFECKGAFDKDRIADLKYDRRYRLGK